MTTANGSAASITNTSGSALIEAILASDTAIQVRAPRGTEGKLPGRLHAPLKLPVLRES